MTRVWNGNGMIRVSISFIVSVDLYTGGRTSLSDTSGMVICLRVAREIDGSPYRRIFTVQ